MATKLLEAAAELGLSPYVVKTTSEGFRVPEEIHRHLFPSQYGIGEEAEFPVELDDTRYDEFDFPALRGMAKRRDLSAAGSSDEIRARLRAADDGGG